MGTSQKHSEAMSERPTIEGLYAQLQNAKEKATCGRYFIRPSRVESIFTTVAIESAVSEISCDANDRINLASKIANEGKFVFATLINMRMEDHVVAFRNHDCLRLPLHKSQAQRIGPNIGLAFAQEHQWQFIPYRFKRDMSDHHYEINETAKILPFLHEESRGDGGHGEVFKVELPASLQEFFHTTVGLFVLALRLC